jgi:hypothetical protein
LKFFLRRGAECGHQKKYQESHPTILKRIKP